MKNNDETILEILQGHKTAKWPSARVVKIFIASTKEDFKNERRILLENVGPELHSVFEDHKIEIELVDMLYGSDEKEQYDPWIFQDHLHEIRHCHKVSRGCFFLSLVGDKYGPLIAPSKLDSETYNSLINLTSNNELLEKLYKKEKDEYVLIQDISEYKFQDWKSQSADILALLYSYKDQMPDTSRKKLNQLLCSVVEQQQTYALGLAPGTAHRILAITREYEAEDKNDIKTFYRDKMEYNDALKSHCESQLENIRSYITTNIPEENRLHFKVAWRGGELEQKHSEHEAYLKEFKNLIFHKLKALISKSLEDEPELKSKKKIVEENFQENITHLTLCYGEVKKDFSSSEIHDKIKQMVEDGNQRRHTPILIYGNQGSGKTSLIQTVYRSFEKWFSCRTLRIVRSISSTPRSSYSLELLRIICQQICIALKLPEGFLPKDASFDPLYTNNWFQSLLRMFEELNYVLGIFLDDLHLVNPLDSDSSTLSWIPISLPKNVHIVCSSGLPIDMMRFTQVQKEKLRQPECYIEMTIVPPYTSFVEDILEQLEKLYSREAISRLASLITCSEYGLTETEILEILMPTSDAEAIISIKDANFNFSSLCLIKRKLAPLIREKIMSGILLIEWRHVMIKELTRKRYLSGTEISKNIHTELSTLFFNEFLEENSDDEASEGEPAPLLSDIKETPFQSTLHKDVTYRIRHIEESWIHLLKSGDIVKLKNLCMCNYDFMLAALQTFSVSYLRCLLEHVRCYLLDREIELVYYSIRKSTDILTRDTFQLGTQLISWLRPVTERGGGLMTDLVTSAMAWCDGFTLPLVVPLNDWLQPPLPTQSKIMTTPNVKLIECAPNGQHVIVVTDSDPELWHIMTNQLVHTFRGHTGKVTCLAVTKQSQYLLTGSDDISIIVWDLKGLSMKLKITEHSAAVHCITSALNNSVIISGGEDSSIIISSLATGKVVTKIDHHRGPVTAIKVTSHGDIMVSGSKDGKVCLWSLTNYNLLNTISISAAVQMLDVSTDSIWLVACCKDNKVYIKTVATGTDVYTISLDHKTKVRSLCITCDSCRVVLGCSDKKTYIYDIHSSKVLKTLSGQSGEVSAVKVTDKDDFLLTAGGNRIIFYPFRSTDTKKSFLKQKKKTHHLNGHTGLITCMDISRDGQLTVTGATDNLVNVWQLNNQELVLSLNGHTGPVTALSFAPSATFVASGSEDKTVKVWGLTLGTLVLTFSRHSASITSVFVLMDSSRIISSDINDKVYIWHADNGTVLQSYSGPGESVKTTTNMKYAVATNGDTTLKIWSLTKDDERYTITHSEEITCFEITVDSQYIITGSKDMSLKVWLIAGGKLSQVLIGHTDTVTCVAVSVADKTRLVSGSLDNTLIVWDINTGADLHTLSAHLSFVSCCKMSGDGSIAISGSDDKSIIIWDTKQGLQLTSLQLHYPIVGVEPTSDFSRIAVLLKDTQYTPIICLHNTPAKYVKLPTYCAPDKDFIENPKSAPKRQMKRLLKKEVSLDTYTWQKKYAHLTSNLVIPSIDERFKRRFSVSASMEEISKIPQNEQKGMGSKQASLAQSQHFDQLEALWNKRSPPNRRRLHHSLSKQSSLAESQISSSDEEHLDGS
ncbi:protein qui-1 [Anthonomus grandis grandis]|uniref:protein qui-1 n=1 Tax=Anthonomus grandis grandis TaxID=2921223 RepID=UPI002165DFA4|nr:protein qui-1 [Anthonomus grandis grandis]XP_050313346.1 protein qui-1 [Anthonomus grandis grandis]XP_050313347.1 protein qui-1 [Anthonomus grandis grandis]XP_050313348.1 protein qui-1 [Anthonomus grandis grandis]XP_050313349.1 protein qui-1 [Anthonomus grandis grandis]XP_050313350.1 protein qui-1 [Anthonomus grandis grandis]